MKYCFMIQHVSGLFSTGSSYPKFSDKGKVWTTRSGISNHFALLGVERAKRIYSQCHVVKFEFTPLEKEEALDAIEEWNERSIQAFNKETTRIHNAINKMREENERRKRAEILREDLDRQNEFEDLRAKSVGPKALR